MAIQDHCRRSTSNRGYSFAQQWLSQPTINFSDINPFKPLNTDTNLGVFRDRSPCKNIESRRDCDISTTKNLLDSVYRRKSHLYENEKRLAEYRQKILNEITSYMKTHCSGGQHDHKGDNFSRNVNCDRRENSSCNITREKADRHEYRELHPNRYLDYLDESSRRNKDIFSICQSTDRNNNDEFFIRGAGDYSSSAKSPSSAGSGRVRDSMETASPPVLTVEALLSLNEAQGRRQAQYKALERPDTGHEDMQVDKRSTRGDALRMLQQNDFLMSVQESGDASSTDTGFKFAILIIKGTAY